MHVAARILTGLFTQSLLRALVVAGALISTGWLSSTAQAQASSASIAGMTRDELTAFAKLDIAISTARDSAQFQLALARNKTPDLQRQLQEKLSTQIAELIRRAGTTNAEYQRKTYLVSSDPDARKEFDALVAKLTGVPTPGQVVAVAAAPAVRVPTGAAGVHVGHVMNGFADTPNGRGLLPTAMAEASTAAQHASLASRTPTNLEAMKLHAGHVIHAIDPTIVTMGPGLGYGVKKAALGVANHIELAGKADGASAIVTMHAAHVETAARAVVTRADKVLALARQIQEATSATDAAALVSQLVSLTAQLTAGVDANGDGRIGWQESEGGLQQAQEHVMLLVAG